MEQNIKSDNQEQNLEFNKIQGFDVLEKLPEDSKMKSYNEEYYSSLSNLKFVSITIPQENKLFYHFEQNPNASVTTTTGQMYVVYKDLKEATLEIKQILGEVEEAIQTIYDQSQSSHRCRKCGRRGGIRRHAGGTGKTGYLYCEVYIRRLRVQCMPCGFSLWRSA